MEVSIDSVIGQNDLVPFVLGVLPVETLLNCVFVCKTWMNLLMNPTMEQSFWPFHYKTIIGGRPNPKKSCKLQVFAIGRIIRNSKKDLFSSIRILIGLYAHKALHHILTLHQNSIDLSKAEDNEKAGYPLHMAVGKSSKKCVEVLMSHGCSPNIVNKSSKKTPKDLATKNEEILFLLCPEVTEPKLLFLALEAKKQSLAIKILETKPFENEYKQNCTPLHIAAKNGLIEVLSFLIHQKKVPIDQPTTQKVQKTALHFAAENGQAETVAFLLQNNASRNANLGRNAFLFAVESGDIQTIKTYLQLFPDDLFSSDSNGNNALHVAATSKNNLPIIQFLVEECKMDINWRSVDTPLDRALSNWKKVDMEFLEKLTQMGADARIGNPITMAIWAGAPKEVVSWLISKGANVNGAPHQPPPLLESLSNGKDDITDLLIESGADLFITDDQNRNVLHCWSTSSQKRVEHAKFFLEKKVPFQKTTYNENPLQSSIWCNDPELSKILLSIAPVETIKASGDDNLVCRSLQVSNEELFNMAINAGAGVPNCALYHIINWCACEWGTPPSKELILKVTELNPHTLDHVEADMQIDTLLQKLKNAEFKQMITELRDAYLKNKILKS
eukprot:TRINITY_DN9015_c0_g2_i1.p1 TRINITY_DN9015_c0_g2~~TRINITY_DN9015_c0_g2_i1.p1  ORF type:complete len:615 (+),score=164.21 TRINITY_DN9015_c0_g2_i1:3-1847(+)